MSWWLAPLFGVLGGLVGATIRGYFAERELIRHYDRLSNRLGSMEQSLGFINEMLWRLRDRRSGDVVSTNRDGGS